MKKILIVLTIFMVTVGGKAQSYLGFYQDNYSGIHGAMYNPGTIAASPFRLDLNLVSGSVLGANDYFGVKFTDVFKNDYDFDTQARKFVSTNNNAVINADVLGLSFMFNLSPKHAIGLFTRARTIVNVVELNGELFDKFEDDFNDSQDYNLTEGDFNMVMNSWAEAGLSYGAVVINKDKHFLKAGVNLKYLQGLANSYAYGRNVAISYDARTFPQDNRITATGQFIYGGTDDFEKAAEDFDFNSNSRGFGADLGLVYEIRKETQLNNYTPNYKLKFGLSVTDIGAINFKQNTQKKYEFNNVTVNENNIENADNLEEVLALFDATPQTTSSVKTLLPTALHANVDWNFFRKFYLNINGDINLNDKKSLNQTSIANTVSLTPRYETKWFSAFLPINYMDYRGLQVGTGFRFGPLFLGSGSVLSNLVSDESKGVDVYFGLKVPIYKGEKRIKEKKVTPVAKPASIPLPVKEVEKDSDADGILDKNDQCPEVKGPKENQGCPYKDTDNDGILDKDDNCPTVFGPKENKGSPWPDVDNDGVLDKDDKCPEIKGTLLNNGCPEVTYAVVKKLNDYAKTILFEANKATFKQGTYPVLEAMVALLKEYPGSKFSIEGHTDSDGALLANQKLSEERASAVMLYLVEQGIETNRLTSIGYGETKPMASNTTKAGKALNRRVEVKLVK